MIELEEAVDHNDHSFKPIDRFYETEPRTLGGPLLATTELEFKDLSEI